MAGVNKKKRMNFILETVTRQALKAESRLAGSVDACFARKIPYFRILRTYAWLDLRRMANTEVESLVEQGLSGETRWLE